MIKYAIKYWKLSLIILDNLFVKLCSKSNMTIPNANTHLIPVRVDLKSYQKKMRI